MITNVEIEDFIGIFDTDVDVSVFRKYYDWMEQNNMAFNRRDADIRVDAVTGMSFFLTIKDGLPMEYSKEFNETIGEALQIYEQEYNALKGFAFQQHYVNIQKTLPGQGYHKWHCENKGDGNTRRVLATMLYLNDDFEGGETEFLYQSRRVKPKAGRVVIWPGSWTHTHRGNPPLTGEKYIATSWLENTRV